MAAKKNAQEKLPDYEKSLEEVEQIIEAIESGEVPLEKSLDRYERGMKLIGHCRTILDRAEQRIEQLAADADGNLESAGQFEEPADDADADEPPGDEQ